MMRTRTTLRTTGPDMMRVNIRFNYEYVPMILDGRKTATTRLEPKGKRGDVFAVGDRDFVITNVFIHPLDSACEFAYEMEGFESPEAMRDALKAIYPEIGEYMQVFVHEFEPV